jgi:hypothetical protein
VSGRAPVFAGVYAGQGRKWMRDGVVTRGARRWRMHRRCMGCEENTRATVPSPRTPPEAMNQRLIHNFPGIAFSRPGRGSCAQGRVKVGCFFSGRPRGLALTGRAPFGDGKRPCRSWAWFDPTSSFLRPRSSPARAETRGFQPGGARLRGEWSPRDRARPSPPRGGPPKGRLIPSRLERNDFGAFAPLQR